MRPKEEHTDLMTANVRGIWALGNVGAGDVRRDDQGEEGQGVLIGGRHGREDEEATALTKQRRVQQREEASLAARRDV